MSKRTVSAYAICPFYRSEDPQKIYCEGVTSHSSIHNVFGDAKYKKSYEQRFCCSYDYKNCKIAKALFSREEDSK